MPIRALTLDFWNTIVNAHDNWEVRHRIRTEQLVRVAARYGTFTSETLEQAQRDAGRVFNERWQKEHRTLGSDEMARLVWQALTIEVDPHDHAETVDVFERSLFDGPPALTEGIRDVLEACAGRYRLGIISDTMFSPGRVLRELLDRHGLLGYFDAFVFSDETGFSKPDPRAFRKALAELGAAPSEAAHVGDLRNTDIAGARQEGLKAILYTGVWEDPVPGPEPDAVLARWTDLESLLDEPDAS